MSVESIASGASDVGARVAAIQAKLDALLGSPAGAAGFDQALSGASASTGAPVATAAGVAAPMGAPATGAAGGALPGSIPFGGEIAAAAARHGLDPALLAGLIKQESGFDPDARSPAGASGLTQLMPGTAASLGVTDPTDPAQAIEGGAKYLAQQLETFGGDVEKALAAYNAGPGAVERYGGVPSYAETQGYVRKVMANAEAFRAQGGGATAAPVASAAAATAALSSPLGTAPVASSPSQFGIE